MTWGGCGAPLEEAEELTAGGGPPGGGRGFEREDVELEYHPRDATLMQQLPRAAQHLHLVPLHVRLQHPHSRVARHLTVESDDGHARAPRRFERLPAVHPGLAQGRRVVLELAAFRAFGLLELEHALSVGDGSA